MHRDDHVRARRATYTQRKANAGIHAYTQAWFDCLLFSFLWPPHKLVIAFCFEDNFPSWNGGILAISFSLHPMHVSNFHHSFPSLQRFFRFTLFFHRANVWRSVGGHGGTDRWSKTPEVLSQPLYFPFTMFSLSPLSFCITRLFGTQNRAGSLLSICTVHLDGIVC